MAMEGIEFRSDRYRVQSTEAEVGGQNHGSSCGEVGSRKLF